MTVRSYHPVLGARKHTSFSVRTRDIVLTILLWMVYLFFMKDVFFFLDDVGHWAWNGFTDAGRYESFKILPTFLSYAEVTAVFVLIYLGWARYNQFRFRGKCRRKAIGPVQAEELAAFYGVGARQVDKWQQARILTFCHDAKGHITAAEFGARDRRVEEPKTI